MDDIVQCDCKLKKNTLILYFSNIGVTAPAILEQGGKNIRKIFTMALSYANCESFPKKTSYTNIVVLEVFEQ